MNEIDILMISYNRPEYTDIALKRLLETCDEYMRVWLWHNGDDTKTLGVLNNYKMHPNIFKFYHSQENKKLNEPTNWLWQNSKGSFVCKVDDDCLMPYGWANKLRSIHHDNPKLGIVGCWRFPDEDFEPEIAKKKIQTLNGNHKILRNCWIEGSGYLMKRECVNQLGLLQDNQSFTNYGIQLARQGWIHGWYFPFLYQEHFDDPRSEHTLLKTDDDIQHWAPLSARINGVKTIVDWQAQLQSSAKLLQRASFNARMYSGWIARLKRIIAYVRRLLCI